MTSATMVKGNSKMNKLNSKKYDIKDLALSPKGKKRIEWARKSMPVLKQIQERFTKEKPLKGLRVSACLHVTTETANLMIALKAGGADTVLCASNPLSTQDDVAASLVKDFDISVLAICGENDQVYYKHINQALDHEPHITMDDGADLVSEIHGKRRALAKHVIGSTEETTTGVIRLKSLEKKKLLLFPVLAINDSKTKHFFDNRYGTGQSTLDGVIRATNILVAGSVFVVCGYGWCGRGLAQKARGLGAQVIVTEIDPLKGLEAVMDGFQVMPLKKACSVGEVFVTVTGNTSVIRKEHFEIMKSGAIVANSGHFNVEIDIPGLKTLTKKLRMVRDFVEEYELYDGRKICMLAGGRLVNLASAEGHPASVMDMSFANQALGAEFLKKNGMKLDRRIYTLPEKIDDNIASLKLKSMGVSIDHLTREQVTYLSSWELGT
jgi:adenosylhomocysteinase